MCLSLESCPKSLKKKKKKKAKNKDERTSWGVITSNAGEAACWKPLLVQTCTSWARGGGVHPDCGLSQPCPGTRDLPWSHKSPDMAVELPGRAAFPSPGPGNLAESGRFPGLR